MKNLFLKIMAIYVEVVGFIAALVFFILAFPVMVTLKLTGLSIEKEL